MTKSKDGDLDQTKRLMAALGRMPPKPHEEMKVGKAKGKPVKRQAVRSKKRQD
jgi:hypothetical protein